MSTREECLHSWSSGANGMGESAKIDEEYSRKPERFRVVIKVGTSTLMEGKEDKKLSFSLSNIGKLVDVVCTIKCAIVTFKVFTSRVDIVVYNEVASALYLFALILHGSGKSDVCV